MRERGLITLTIIASVCIASIGLVPMGCGPYTAVHGPLSALRAQRAFLLLSFAIASLFWLAAAWVLSRFFSLGTLRLVVDPASEAAGCSSLHCSLRC